MEENRAFDHLLGFAWRAGVAVNGLRGNESNPLNTSEPLGPRVTVDSNSSYVGACDPNHSTPATTSKIFGAAAVAAGNLSHPDMSGFVEWQRNDPDYCGVMSAFDPERLPVMMTLAAEFAVMDRLFASHPGPTWPNRLFALSATTAGATETDAFYRNQPGHLFPQKTIFDQVEDAGLTTTLYYNDTVWELFLESLAHNPQRTAPMQQFFDDAAAGTLPSFSWINPSAGMNVTTGVGSNDQHPDHDVAAGEGLYKAIYEALRAGPAWADTLFIITYDEHGGLYDHVPPPMNVPSPGDPDSARPYPDTDWKFDRLGVRIPTLLVSPRIPKGTVISEPPETQKPDASSEYELTSIMATTRKLLGMNTPPLSRRDAWAATFEHALSLDAPRADCPLHLPDAPAPATAPISDEGQRPLNDLQRHISAVHNHLSGRSSPGDLSAPLSNFEHTDLATQADVSEWLLHRYNEHQERMISAQQLRLKDWSWSSTTYTVAVRSDKTPGWCDSQWVVSSAEPSLPYSAISSMHFRGPSGTAMCLDVGPQGATNGTVVGVATCGAGDGTSPADPAQRWVMHPDATVRPFSEPGLCLTTHRYDDVNIPSGDDNAPVTLQDCSSQTSLGLGLWQHWGWRGPAPGNPNIGAFVLGNNVRLGIVASGDATHTSCGGR